MNLEKKYTMYISWLEWRLGDFLGIGNSRTKDKSTRPVIMPSLSTSYCSVNLQRSNSNNNVFEATATIMFYLCESEATATIMFYLCESEATATIMFYLCESEATATKVAHRTVLSRNGNQPHVWWWADNL